MNPLDPRLRAHDVDDEIRTHLEAAMQERMACGATREEAERDALREFGDVALVKRATLAVWGMEPELAFAGASTANDRMKASFRSWFWAAMIAAVVAHAGVFAMWPEMVAGSIAVPSNELTVIAPPTVDIPPAPEALPRPALPVATTVELEEDLTIGLTTFEENPVSVLPPPPPNTSTDIAAAPTFMPRTVEPRVLNRDDVVRAMEREYPAVLRDAGIGGTVTVFFFIDEAGVVRDRRIDRSSGVDGLDEAALEVAETFRFSPALNRDRRVPVWVSLPIRFQVR